MHIKDFKCDFYMQMDIERHLVTVILGKAGTVGVGRQVLPGKQMDFKIVVKPLKLRIVGGR